MEDCHQLAVLLPPSLDSFGGQRDPVLHRLGVARVIAQEGFSLNAANSSSVRWRVSGGSVRVTSSVGSLPFVPGFPPKIAARNMTLPCLTVIVARSGMDGCPLCRVFLSFCG